MIYEVTATKQADIDLRGIYEYIAFEKRFSLLTFGREPLY